MVYLPSSNNGSKEILAVDDQNKYKSNVVAGG